MRFAGLRHYASINDHFFGDGFSFQFRDFHLWNRASLLLFFSKLELLRDPGKPADDQHDHDSADDDSLLSHLACNTFFVGRSRPEAVSSAVCAPSIRSWGL